VKKFEKVKDVHHAQIEDPKIHLKSKILFFAVKDVCVWNTFKDIFLWLVVNDEYKVPFRQCYNF